MSVICLDSRSMNFLKFELKFEVTELNSGNKNCAHSCLVAFNERGAIFPSQDLVELKECEKLVVQHKKIKSVISIIPS